VLQLNGLKIGPVLFLTFWCGSYKKKCEPTLDSKRFAAYVVNDNITQFLGCVSLPKNGSQHRILQEMIDDKLVGFSQTSSGS
jgi:hypothetical protein